MTASTLPEEAVMFCRRGALRFFRETLVRG